MMETVAGDPAYAWFVTQVQTTIARMGTTSGRGSGGRNQGRGSQGRGRYNNNYNNTNNSMNGQSYLGQESQLSVRNNQGNAVWVPPQGVPPVPSVHVPAAQAQPQGGAQAFTGIQVAPAQNIGSASVVSGISAQTTPTSVPTYYRGIDGNFYRM
jgi:hypothetical protein